MWYIISLLGGLLYYVTFKAVERIHSDKEATGYVIFGSILTMVVLLGSIIMIGGY